MISVIHGEMVHESSEVLILDAVEYPALIGFVQSPANLNVNTVPPRWKDTLICDAHAWVPDNSGMSRNGKDCPYETT